MKEATNKDQEMVKLREAILNNDEKYNRYGDRLSVQEVDVMFDFKVVVPEMLRAGH